MAKKVEVVIQVVKVTAKLKVVMEVIGGENGGCAGNGGIAVSDGDSISENKR